MKSSRLRAALVLSLLMNLGVLGAIGYRALKPDPAHPQVGAADGFRGLARHLSLSEEQQRRWRDAETPFIGRLTESGSEILRHRNRLIDEMFADAPDPARIEAVRANIARLQNERQQIVVQQLLREREILDPDQRARLAQLLRSQPAGVPDVERLHRD